MYYRRYRYFYNPPSKNEVLKRKYGPLVEHIKSEFFKLDQIDFDYLLDIYGKIYGSSAKSYARKTYPKWKSGSTNLSGQTMQRILDLVPPFLSTKKRYTIVKDVCEHFEVKNNNYEIRINIEDPEIGIKNLLSKLNDYLEDSILKHLPQPVLDAFEWLNEGDVVLTRKLLANIDNELAKSIVNHANKDIQRLVDAIQNNRGTEGQQIFKFRTGMLRVVIYRPKSFVANATDCFIATAVFGKNDERVSFLREFRDIELCSSSLGRFTIRIYYRYGRQMSYIVSRSKLLKKLISLSLNKIIHLMGYVNGQR